MKPSVKLDAREFNAAMRQYLTLTKKDLATVLNEKAHRIAWDAYHLTPRATPEEIEEDLMQPGESGGAVLYAIVQSRALRKTGKGLTLEQMAKAAKRYLGKRRGASGYMRSGWLQALENLSRVLGKPMRRSKFGKVTKRGGRAMRGGSTVAKWGWNPMASIFNQALSRFTPQPGNLDRYAGRALQLAFNNEVASMRTYIARKLQQTARRFNG
jgi:hypothetical protein